MLQVVVVVVLLFSKGVIQGLDDMFVCLIVISIDLGVLGCDDFYGFGMVNVVVVFGVLVVSNIFGVLFSDGQGYIYCFVLNVLGYFIVYLGEGDYCVFVGCDFDVNGLFGEVYELCLQVVQVIFFLVQLQVELGELMVKF